MIITFKFDNLITNFAHINHVLILTDPAVVVAVMMTIGELLNELRLVVGLMIVGLNSFPRTTQLLPTNNNNHFKQLFYST